MPSPRDATVASTGGSHGASAPASTAFPRPAPSFPARGWAVWWGATCRNAFPRRIPSITSTSWRSLSAPGRSLLLTTYTSAISITPALRVWMPSPDSGTSTRTVVSALRAMSSSVCPTPTVSTRMRAKPNASSRSATSSVVVASPPCAPRVAIERMNTCGSRLADSIRIRSPSSAPPVNGLVGSTATTPTESAWARNCWMSRSVSVLLPAPGGPVIPMRRAPPNRVCACDRTRSNPSRWFSTRLIARASAAGSRRSSPSRIASSRIPSPTLTITRPCVAAQHAAPLLLPAVERHRPHRSRAHRDPLDARRARREDVELQAPERESLAGARNPPEDLHEQAPHRLRAPIGCVERHVERLLQLAGGGAALQFHDADGRGAARGRRLGLEDLGDEVAQQILEGHEARRAAELVQHDREVTAPALHLEHQIGRARRAGDHERGPNRHRGVGRELE